MRYMQVSHAEARELRKYRKISKQDNTARYDGQLLMCILERDLCWLSNKFQIIKLVCFYV